MNRWAVHKIFMKIFSEKPELKKSKNVCRKNAGSLSKDCPPTLSPRIIFHNTRPPHKRSPVSQDPWDTRSPHAWSPIAVTQVLSFIMVPNHKVPYFQVPGCNVFTMDLDPLDYSLSSLFTGAGLLLQVQGSWESHATAGDSSSKCQVQASTRALRKPHNCWRQL